MEPIKYVKDHPAFQRVAKDIARTVATLRPTTLQLAMHNMTRPGLLVDKDRLPQAVSAECDRIEYSLVRRQLRKHGFAGKYVAH